MTEDTMNAVIVELAKRGVPATLEYPGIICIESRNVSIHFGDANKTLDGDVYESDGVANENIIETIESSIPSDSTDVQRIADHIACCYTQAQEVAGLKCPLCGVSAGKRHENPNCRMEPVFRPEIETISAMFSTRR